MLSPGLNDGPELDRTIGDLYRLGEPVLTVSVVPVGLTEFSRHGKVREPTREECAAAIRGVERWSRQAVAERSGPWIHGADELYLRAGEALPPAEAYGDFEQVENGVGSVRWLQQQIARGADRLAGWEGLRIGVLTGTSMGRLMPEVLDSVAAVSGARFELVSLENPLFGSPVTCAGLLPGRALLEALRDRRDLDLALLPGEAVNDEGRFLDDLAVEALAAASPVPVLLSRSFVDVAGEPVLA